MMSAHPPGDPLHVAALNGDVHEARELLDKGLRTVNCRDVYDDETPLHCACRRGHLAVVRVLVSEFNANLNIRDVYGRTALFHACDGGHLDVIRVLVSEFKADLATSDDGGWTPLLLVCNEKKIDVIRVLVSELGADLSIRSRKGWTPLHHACAKGHLDIVMLLSELKADLAIRGGVRGLTPMHCASAEGRLDVVEFLVSEFDAGVTIQDNSGWTPLHCACDGGHLAVVRALVSKFNADSNAPDNGGRTGAMLAARKAHDSIVIALLLEFKCPVNARDGNGKSVIHHACAGGSVNLLRALILSHKADCNALDEDGNTPLRIAAYEDNLEIAQLLIEEFGCDPRAGNAGQMLLFRAIAVGNVSLVKTLLDVHGAYANARGSRGGTLLQMATAEGKLAIAHILIKEYGCNPTIGNVGQTLLYKACRKGDISLLQTLLEYVSPLLTDYNGDTLLHLVSQVDNLRCVEFLALANAPLLVRNKDGKSPIDVAKGSSKEFLVQYLDKNKKSIRNHYNKILAQAKKKYAGPQYITRMFVLGYPDAGKSSFIECLKREGLFESLSKVSESSVPPHTAGIIPSEYMSKQHGRVLFYDFAGDAEYYSSHAAIFESFASSRKGENLFIVVVDLRRDNITIETTLHYWFSFVQYQKFSNISFMVVGSHLDEISKDINGIEEKSQILEKFCEAVHPNVRKTHFSTLNCRDPRSNQIVQFKRQIFSWISGSNHSEIGKEASLLLGLLERDFRAVTACPVKMLAAHIEDLGVCLPTDTRALHHILLKLHEFGILLLLGDHSIGYHHVILNMAKLTNKVHELLFSEKSAISSLKRSYPGFQSAQLNVGILPESILEEVLPKYITKECLVYLQYCQQISHADIRAFQQCEPVDAQSFLFFPALCSVDKSQVSWEEAASNSFRIGWLALCADPPDYFPPRFLHVLLLRLVHSFTLAMAGESQTAYASPEHSRHCVMWKNGIHWSNEKKIDCIVEVVNMNRGVVVFSQCSSEWREDCTDVFTKVISCVMEAKAEFCHSIKPRFFLLDSCVEADYHSEDHQFAMSDVITALEYPGGKNLVLSLSGRGKMEISKFQCLRKLSPWRSLFPIDFSEVLHFLQDVTREIYELGDSLGIPQAVLHALEEDFPSDDRRRRELVWWWMSSSPDTPCWWQLVQALQGIGENVLAEKVKKKHGKPAWYYFRVLFCLL